MDTKTSPLSALADSSLLKTDALIGGEWIAGSTRFQVSDPATGDKLADVANLSPADAHTAIVPPKGLAVVARQERQTPAILMKWFACCTSTPTTWRAS
jgi:succinate-semialdehyde dehydrogenase/glutarate-semialdehyde dehydrogenase